MNLDYILKTSPYKGILYLLYNYPNKITFLHLRYRLIKNHGIKLKNSSRKLTKKAKILNSCFGDVEIIKKQIELIKYRSKDKVIDETEEFLNPKIEGIRPTTQLSNDLNRLKKIEPHIIEKKGENYYITELGEKIFQRYYLHWYIDTKIPDIGIPHTINLFRAIGKPQKKYHPNLENEFKNIFAGTDFVYNQE